MIYEQKFPKGSGRKKIAKQRGRGGPTLSRRLESRHPVARLKDPNTSYSLRSVFINNQ